MSDDIILWSCSTHKHKGLCWSVLSFINTLRCWYMTRPDLTLHTAALTRQFLANQNVHILSSPTNCLDMNPIDHIWDMVNWVGTPDFSPSLKLLTLYCHLEAIKCFLWFLVPLAEGQRAFVMALCLSCVRLSVHVCVRKLFLQKTSQKPLTQFLRNFTGMFLRWSSFKFLQIFGFYEEFWLPWRLK